jgi:hypothetical protein
LHRRLTAVPVSGTVGSPRRSAREEWPLRNPPVDRKILDGPEESTTLTGRWTARGTAVSDATGYKYHCRLGLALASGLLGARTSLFTSAISNGRCQGGVARMRETATRQLSPQSISRPQTTTFTVLGDVGIESAGNSIWRLSPHLAGACQWSNNTHSVYHPCARCT